MNVARLVEGKRHIFCHFDSSVVAFGLNHWQCLVNIVVIEKRFVRMRPFTSLFPMSFFLVGKIFQLNVSCISQHDFDEVCGGRCHKQGRIETFTHKSRNQAAMIDMSMREHERIDALGGNGTFSPIPRLELTLLKQATIDHDSRVGSFETVP